jgi:hypothetical protein
MTASASKIAKTLIIARPLASIPASAGSFSAERITLIAGSEEGLARGLYLKNGRL